MEEESWGRQATGVRNKSFVRRIGPLPFDLRLTPNDLKLSLCTVFVVADGVAYFNDYFWTVGFGHGGTEDTEIRLNRRGGCSRHEEKSATRDLGLGKSCGMPGAATGLPHTHHCVGASRRRRVATSEFHVGIEYCRVHDPRVRALRRWRLMRVRLPSVWSYQPLVMVTQDGSFCARQAIGVSSAGGTTDGGWMVSLARHGRPEKGSLIDFSLSSGGVTAL
jgi:hypothetical protein